MTRNYIRYIPASSLRFSKRELNFPKSDYRKNAYSLPLFVYSSLFLSHDIRKDVNVFLILSDDIYKIIQISSNRLRNMRPDFRSILLILDKAIKLVCKRRLNHLFFQRSGIRIFKSLEELRATLNQFSLIIVEHGDQTLSLTSLPKDEQYLIQIGVPSTDKANLESYFPLFGKIYFPFTFNLCVVPSVLNIEFDRSQIFDRRVDSATQ
ncbi:MAG: hypothetical protein ACE5R6_06785 [Candidatus Heimdallarchaeota archaeon]